MNNPCLQNWKAGFILCLMLHRLIKSFLSVYVFILNVQHGCPEHFTWLSIPCCREEHSPICKIFKTSKPLRCTFYNATRHFTAPKSSAPQSTFLSCPASVRHSRAVKQALEFARQMDRWHFKSEISPIHLLNWPSESFQAVGLWPDQLVSFTGEEEVAQSEV